MCTLSVCGNRDFHTSSAVKGMIGAAVAHEGVEQQIEHGAVGAALVGLFARFRVHVAVEAVLADVEEERAEIDIGEIIECAGCSG
jgi:hypothetical protein